MSAVSYIRETLLPELPPCAYILLSAVLREFYSSSCIRALLSGWVDLLHDIQLRSASNRMDAHNLTIVICPNLVMGPNPMRDVMMCSVPNAPTLFDAARAASSTPGARAQTSPSLSTVNPAALTEGKTSLGMVIKICIQRYYEIFDDVPDRSEALSQEVVHPPNPFSDVNSPGSPSLNNRDSALLDDDEIDDAMLVMPLGPNNPHRVSGGGQVGSGMAGSSTFRPHHRSSQSKDAAARSTHTAFGNGGNGGGSPSIYGTVNKARSTISIERGNPSKKGSIALGRGTARGKSVGSGVQAVGITAEGFFAAPNAPPVPTLPSQVKNGS